MRAEVRYAGMVAASLIGDLIRDTEWNMKRVSPSDRQFVQLSNEKFALETILEQISESDEPPEIIMEEFIDNMTEMMCETQNADTWNLYAAERAIIEKIFTELYSEEEH